jgi:hypothetical protein
MDTTGEWAGSHREKKKGRVFTRPAGTFLTLEVSGSYCFGAAGAAGLVVPAPAGLAPAGFAAPDEAGAATPDWVL